MKNNITIMHGFIVILIHICMMLKQLKALQHLRIVGWLEGISYLVLLFVSMPLKYLFRKPEAVLINGWIHGFLFVVLAFLILRAALLCQWPFKRLFVAGLASLIPFGTFWFDKQLKTEQQRLKGKG